MQKPVCAVDSQCTLGEGPLWIPSQSCVYWVDIKQAVIHRLNTETNHHEQWQLDDMVTSLTALENVAPENTTLENTGLEKQDATLLGTSRHGLVKINFDEKTMIPYRDIESHIPSNRFNDGKVDIHGNYWFGSMDDAEEESTGKLYCLSANTGGIDTIDDNYIITNGPAFSHDGTRLYHTDTLDKTIYVFDLDANGIASNKRPFITLPEDTGYPDGMTVDSENCLWVCHFAGWRVTRYNAAGDLIQTIPMPVANTTSCTFAGDDMQTLYLTTAQKGLSNEELTDQPTAGGLFKLRTDVKGVPATPYRGSLS